MMRENRLEIFKKKAFKWHFSLNYYFKLDL